jgi:hypothetical protein
MARQQTAAVGAAATSAGKAPEEVMVNARASLLDYEKLGQDLIGRGCERRAVP